MIRSTSEAICETVGSIKNQHAGKNCHLEPEYFSMELVLRFNLGPIHLLDDFVDEILSSDTGKTYLRKETKLGRVISKDLNKSASITSFEAVEISPDFLILFGFKIHLSKPVNIQLYLMSVIHHVFCVYKMNKK